MNFKLNFEINKPNFSIKHGEGILFLGSCFSDEMANKVCFHGFRVNSNPFGTVFHPSLLSQFIDHSIKGVNEERVFNRNDIFLSWDANSTVFDYSKNDLESKLKHLRTEFLNELKTANVLFITFGTAWAYRKKEDNHLVANCHKIPNNQFEKELSSIEDLYKKWIQTVQTIHSINPELKIVFTVSPVRHIRDGLIENNQSKSILIELVRRLTLDSKISYFPSYEILIDELRDYRFFKSDRVHPTDEAIQYIWERFESTFFDKKTIQLNKRVANFRRMISHRSIHESAKDNIDMKNHVEILLTDFLRENPDIFF